MRRVQVLRLLSYTFDWAVLIAAVGVFQRVGQIAGHRQAFSLTDITIKYAYTGPSTVSSRNLLLLSVAFPAVVIVFCTILLDRMRSTELGRFAMLLYSVNNSWLGLALSICLSQVFTNVLKITVGRPRPDMLSRCIPAEGAADPAPYGLSTSSICTQTSAGLLNDGFRSFPSGHSSMAFSGLAYLTLYLAWRISLFDKRGEVWKWVIVVTPFVAASLVAASRIIDNRHHPFDVLFGSSIGIVTSFFAFYQYHADMKNNRKRYPLRFSEDHDAQTADRGRPISSNSDIALESLHGGLSGQSSRTQSPEDVRQTV